MNETLKELNLIYKPNTEDYTKEELKLINQLLLGKHLFISYKTLCPECHIEEHNKRDKSKIDLSTMSAEEKLNYLENKANSRANKGDSYIKFKTWLDKQSEGRILSTKDLYKESGLNKVQLFKLKEKNSYIREWLNSHNVKRGYYKI